MRIFVSHSHQDNDWCNAFVEELKRYGADVWYDKQGLYVGAKWRQTIETELEERDIFLLVLTPNSWASSWVQDELTLAMSHQKRIVSVLHQPAQVSGFLTNYQMLDVIGLSSAEAAKAVAAALGLSRMEQPATSTKADDEKYEYFEITPHHINFVAFSFQIMNVTKGQVFYRLKYWDNVGGFLTNPDRAEKIALPDIKKLRDFAKTNGLEDLPEKGAHWYSYRFRRKKQ